MLGYEVVTGPGKVLGKLLDVMPGASNDIWVVQSDSNDNVEMLTPALRTIVAKVDEEKRGVIVDLPPGPREIYEKPGE